MTVLAIPNPLDTDAELNRFYHYDLASREEQDLRCELCSARCQLWLLKSSDRLVRVLGLFERRRRVQWLEERISRIEGELRTRRYASWETRSQPKPRLSRGVIL